MVKKYLAEELVHKYTQGSCTKEEKYLVESWHLKDLEVSNYLPSKDAIFLANKRSRKTLLTHIGYMANQEKIHKLWPRLAFIASILFLISFVVYFNIKTTDDHRLIAIKKETRYDILPGSTRAILTLSGGKKITLNNNVHENLFTQEDNIGILKTRHGILTYPHADNNTSGMVHMNRLETPRGGQYQVKLPDGTNVWLNASSSLTYPTTFNGKERKIGLTGEAYFEVAKNKDKPFRICSGSQTIEVLGTHFNISAYPDDQKIQTTLIEGSIKVIKGPHSKLIKAGQAATTSSLTDTIAIAIADVEKNMAWKNNEFIFNGENLENIMRSISRWYDIEIVYQGNSNQTRYWGVISRTQNLWSVLNMLQSTGKISFKLEGRRVIVMN